MNNSTTQRELIIKLLQEAGDRGVTSFALTYDHQIKQAPTRCYELKKLGFNIISKPYKNSVRYILSSRPKDEVVVKPPQLHELNQQTADRLVRVEKNGRTYWEEPKAPEQMHI